jgi:hypothetical protein
MITNFENYTFDLTEFERSLLPVIAASLQGRTSQNPIKEPAIIFAVNYWLLAKGINKTISGVRLRKIVGQLRIHSVLPIIATQHGYFVSYDREVIKKQIKSLNERAGSIVACANGLKAFLGEKPG